MRPLEREDLVDLEAYPSLRSDYRRAVIAHKRARRMSVGDHVTLLFEDRETLRFQVLEMLFVERIGDATRIQNELDVYNELIPGERELSATLFVEITEPGRIRPELDRLIGIDEHVALEISEGDDRQVVPARFDTKQMEEDRLSAVQYIRFTLDEKQAALFCDPALPAWIRIDHPNYAQRASIAPEVRASLVAGLADAPPPLLEPATTPVTPPARRILFETANVLAWSPGAGSAHVIVETRHADPSLLDPDSALWDELCSAVQRAARETRVAHRACRIEAEVGAVDRPARFDVIAIEERDEH